MEYYISVGNGKRGPYSVEELKARGITSETLVMAESSATWVPAWQVEELRGIISVKPEPVAEPFGSPSATAQGQPIDSNFENNFNDGERLDNPFRQTSAGAAPNYQQGRPVAPPQPPAGRKSGGGGIGKLIAVLIVIVALVGIAIVTCPDEQAHKDALTEVVSSAISDDTADGDSTFDNSDMVSKMFKQISGSWTKEVVASAVDNLIHVDNHFIFSTGKVRFGGKESTVSIGIFGHVFTVGKDYLRKAAEAYYSKAEREAKEKLKQKASRMFNDAVVEPARQAVDDAIKEAEQQIRESFGNDFWPSDDASGEEASDSSSAVGGF